MTAMIITIMILACSYRTSSCAVTDFDLGQGGTGVIGGQIYDNRFGAPVSDGKVTVLEKERVFKRTSSDQLGNYEITDVPEGTYTITVESTGFAYTQRTVRLRRGERKWLEIPLRIGHIHDPIAINVNGRVRLSDGMPANNATVVVISPFDQQFAGNTLTNQSGEFSIHVDDPGQYVLYVFKPGFQVVSVPMLLRPTLPRKPYRVDMVLQRFQLR